MEKKQGYPARQASYKLLLAVLKDQKSLAELPEDSGLKPDEAAFSRRITLTVLRNLSNIDELLSLYCDRLPPVEPLTVLRMAVAELLIVKSAPYAVVDAAVSMMVGKRNSRYRGMANAVLRKVSETGLDHWAQMPPSPLPKWLRQRFEHLFGPSATAAMESVIQGSPPLDLTLKKPTDTKNWASKLDARILPTGSIRLQEFGAVTAMPGFDDGAWWVQDAAAALPVKVLDVGRDERVLDLCAAPGGKTMQLAAAGSQVTAVDKSESRLRRVQENLTRTGLTANLVAADATTFTAEPFDAILVDAPCSATGTLRRHPDLPYVKSTKKIGALVGIQKNILRQASSLLKPGGKLVYCTCSILPEEGEKIVAWACENLPLKALPIDPGSLGIPQDWVLPAGGIATRPDLWADCGGIDGFYINLLQRSE